MTDKEMQMYGCEFYDFRESVIDSITYKVSGGVMVLAGLLSDAQELMAMGDTETARKYLNRAKALMFEMSYTGNLTFLPKEGE
jgi:Flp pilus assembly protein protease CpaA